MFESTPVNKYVEYAKQVVKSLKALNGEPVFNRTRDAGTTDLPVVVHSEQKRPSLKADAVSKLIEASSGQEQALYVLLAATGMRVSEARRRSRIDIHEQRSHLHLRTVGEEGFT